MSINIRNELIEKHLEEVQKKMLKDFKIDKMSYPQTVDELIRFYEKKRGN